VVKTYDLWKIREQWEALDYTSFGSQFVKTVLDIKKFLNASEESTPAP
jgi:hypothetical protein